MEDTIEGPPEKLPAKRGKAKAKPKVEVVPFKFIERGGTKEELLKELYNQWYGCRKCLLCEFRPNDDIVFGQGNPDADVLVVGEAPGEQEEATGIPFIGGSGNLLNQIIAQSTNDAEVREAYNNYVYGPKGIKKSEAARVIFTEKVMAHREAEFFMTNAVACRPPDMRQPVQTEIKACWERLWNIIYIVDPVLIITLGNSALSAVMQKSKVQVSKARGHVVDVSGPGRVVPVTYPVFPLFHPSYLLQKADFEDSNGDWNKTVEDWRKAMQTLDFLRNKNFGIPTPQRGVTGVPA